jgi:hypothetical protein
MDDEFLEELGRIRQRTEADRLPDPPPVIRPLVSHQPASLARESPQPEIDYYEKFLETIRQGKHPRFCELCWEPPNFYIRFTVKFQGDVIYPEQGQSPDREERRRAFEYFSCYTPFERMMFSFIVVIQEWTPTVAKVSVRPELPGIVRSPGTKRFSELSTPAWYKPR